MAALFLQYSDTMPLIDQNALITMFNAGRYTEVEQACSTLLEQQPDSGFLWKLFGACLKMQDKESLFAMQKAADLSPFDFETHNNLGVALFGLEKFDKAVAAFQTVLQIQPKNIAAHHNLGNALQKLGRVDDAFQCYMKVLEIEPDSAKTNNGLAIVFNNMGRERAALECNQKALELDPFYAEAHNTRGLIKHDFGNLDAAIVCWLRALELDPDLPEARFNYSLYLLLNGNFQGGWKNYEARWHCKNLPSRPIFPQPLWLGDADLSGKTILLYGEQGLGDVLQCIRYIENISQLGATVLLYLPVSLRVLLFPMAGVSGMYGNEDALPHFDYQCPLMSLPLAFNTGLATIPCKIPYVTAKPDRVQYWAGQLGMSHVPRVGLVWSGRPTHGKDRNRSIPFATMALLLGNATCRFFSLQQDVRKSDLPALKDSNITDLSTHLTDFSETAAIIANLDLVITVDTAVAHLAGAMGKPVWIMLPFVPDWRWMLEREDSPWYPTVRLFRQPALGDWGSVVAKVQDALRTNFLKIDFDYV